MKKWLMIELCLMLLVGVAVTARAVVRRHKPEKPARFLVVQRGDLRAVVHDRGTVEPLSRVDVKSKVSGRILRIAVAEGQRVRTGDLIAEIDGSEILSQVNQIRAQIAAAQARQEQAETDLSFQTTAMGLAQRDAEQGLRAARARLAQAERQSRAQPTLTGSAIAGAEASCRAAEAALDALRQSTQPQAAADARAALDQAQANAGTSERQLQRLRVLLSKGFVPLNQVEDAERDCANAGAARDAARERVDTLAQRQAAERGEAEARVAQMRAALATARANAMQDGLRADDLAAARAAYEQARVACQRARAADAQVAGRRAEVAAAAAGVRQLEDQLAEALVRLHDTTIRAPLSGTVTKRYVEPGELITSGIATFSSGMPIVQIADLSRMQVVCQLNEVDVARVGLWQPVEITLDGARGRDGGEPAPYPGRVIAVAPAAARPSSEPHGFGAGGESPGPIVRFAVKVALLRTDRQLKPGMSVDVDILTASRKKVLMLPIEAVELGARPARVRLLRDGHAVSASVQTGLKNETIVRIPPGLREGDRVLPAAGGGIPSRRRDGDAVARAGGGR